MREVRRLIKSFGSSNHPVLITGDPGTGTEIVARALHACSSRVRVMAMSCVTITSALADSILFGQVKGAFTGATSGRDGVLLHSAGGTLFLDELAELPGPTQATLLRGLDPGEDSPAGLHKTFSSNVRLLAACSVVLI